MADIFISYARSEDRSRVEPLAKALKDQDWSVFWDRTIPAGMTWRHVIGVDRSVIALWLGHESVETTFLMVIRRIFDNYLNIFLHVPT